MNIANIYTSESGKLIKKHLENTISKLDMVTDIDTTLSNDKIAVSVLAKIESIRILNKVLQLTDINEESTSLEDKVKNLKKKNGL